MSTRASMPERCISKLVSIKSVASKALFFDVRLERNTKKETVIPINPNAEGKRAVVSDTFPAGSENKAIIQCIKGGL